MLLEINQGFTETLKFISFTMTGSSCTDDASAPPPPPPGLSLYKLRVKAFSIVQPDLNI